jgi:hypothetical protein
MEKLIQLVSELNAPKNQYNSFGKYSYRNIEDIQEAFKPLGFKYGLKLTFEDEAVELTVDGVVTTSIKSVAYIKDAEGNIVDKATGYAGVERRKGMDLAQTFGASTSYARKYAAGSLLNIDDTKDADSMSKPQKSSKPTLNPNSDAFVKAIAYIKDGGDISKIEEKYAITTEVKKQIAKALA